MGQELRFEEGAKDMASGVGPERRCRCCVFKGMTESIAPMCSMLSAKPARIYRFPVGSGPDPKARRKETRLPVRATSSGRLFLDRLLASMARLRFTDIRNLTCTLHKIRQKVTFLLCQQGDIST